MEYYYTDPLAAAWMAKHFGMKHQLLNEKGESYSEIEWPNYVFPEKRPEVDLKRYSSAPALDIEEEFASRPPNFRACASATLAYQQEPVASGCVERERPADKRASHAHLSGVDGSSLEKYRYVLRFILKINVKKRLAWSAGNFLKLLKGCYPYSIKSFGFFGGKFSTCFEISKRIGCVYWFSIHLTIICIHNAILGKNLDDICVSDFVGHLISPAPVNPRRDSQLHVAKPLYHPMSDVSTLKSSIYNNFPSFHWPEVSRSHC